MTHVVSLVEAEGGVFWQCSCGERAPSLLSRYEAEEEAAEHERHARLQRHRVPTPRPSIKTLVNLYRQRENQVTYTLAERARWKALADELEAHLPQEKNPVIPGQLGLFD